MKEIETVDELEALLNEEGRDRLMTLMSRPQDLFLEVPKEAEPLVFMHDFPEVMEKFPNGWRPRLMLSPAGEELARYFAMYARYTHGKSECRVNNPANL